MTALEEYINSFFGIIDPDELAVIADLFKKSSIRKGDYLVESGKICGQLSFVETGLLRMFEMTKDKEITQWISAQGYFSADLSSFLFETPSRLSIQAIEDTEVYSISKKDYLIIGELVPNWHALEKTFILRCFIMLEQRIWTHLSMTAEERYHAFFENNKALFNKVPLQYIASMLGMTPETFSRIRKKQFQ